MQALAKITGEKMSELGKPVYLGEDHPTFKRVVCRYRNTNKELVSRLKSFSSSNISHGEEHKEKIMIS